MNRRGRGLRQRRFIHLKRQGAGAGVQGPDVCACRGMSMGVRIEIPKDRIAEFCRRWQVKELAVFGSALGDNFRPDSDVDVLVVFQDDAKWDLFDHMKAEEELKQIFGREVDLVEKKAIRNPFRRHHILSNYEVIYAA